jgi:hypothetical protein
VFLRQAQPELYSSLISLRCRNAALALLLKDMQHVNDLREHCLRGPVGLAIMVIRQLHYLARYPLAKRASADWMVSMLSVQKCPAKHVLNIGWKALHVPQARAYPQ